MVDSTLIEQVLALDVDERLHLRGVIDDSLHDDEIPAEILTIIDQRLSEMGPTLSPSSIRADEDERIVRSRRGKVA